MNFLSNFLHYNSGNECPESYCLWTAYSLLSAAVGRRVHINMDYFKVHPHLYVLLVGDSGMRKTAASDLGITILKAADPSAAISADNETYQGVIKYLASDSAERTFMGADGKLVTYRPYLIFASELMDLIQNNPEGYIRFLTNIHDKPDQYIYRLKDEDKVLPNPFVMMCACTTPVWLTDQIKAKTFSEGYGRRSIVVCADTRRRCKPVLTDSMRAARDLCIADLKRIRGLAGVVRLDDAADAFFWDWYHKLKEPDDAFIRNWYSTLHILVLKVAMLSSLADGNDLVITKNYIALAIDLLMDVEKRIPILTSRMGRSELLQPMQEILSVVRANGGIITEKRLKLLSIRHFKDSQEQWRTINHMIDTDQLIKTKAKKKVIKDGQETEIAVDALELPERTKHEPPLHQGS